VAHKNFSNFFCGFEEYFYFSPTEASKRIAVGQKKQNPPPIDLKVYVTKRDKK
jgi:hypothetical protein